jgi:hypothetical protein
MKKRTTLIVDDPRNPHFFPGIIFPGIKRVKFPLFKICSNPVIPLQKVKERRFDLIQRAQDISREEIKKKALR